MSTLLEAQAELFASDIFDAGATPSSIALDRYSLAVEPALQVYLALPNYRNALDLSRAIVNAIFDLLPHGAKLMLSTSWGKDSTVLVALVIDVMLDRRDANLPTAPVLVMTARTGGDFPDMEQRIDEEMALLVRFAERERLDIKCHITQPAAKNSLLAEFIGGGRPLPKYASSDRVSPVSWCVDRLKTYPIEQTIRIAKGQSTFVAHLIGVRSDESTRRAATMERNRDGFPFGLTSLKMGKAADLHRIGVTPIEHWSHEDLTQFLRQTLPAWDSSITDNSFDRLKAIYRKGATAADLNGMQECRIAFTRDGGTTNACRDLSQGRFGCALCPQAENVTLKEYYRKDPSYRWLVAAHRHLHSGIREHQRRLEDIEAKGFSDPLDYTLEKGTLTNVISALSDEGRAAVRTALDSTDDLTRNLITWSYGMFGEETHDATTIANLADVSPDEVPGLVKTARRKLASKIRQQQRASRFSGPVSSEMREVAASLRSLDGRKVQSSTLFPKNYLFSWRVRLLAFVLRAEIQHGHRLITPEIESAIEAWWGRSGIFTVTVDDIRKDVRAWIITGKLRFSHEEDACNFDNLASTLSEGIPGGIYAKLMFPETFKQDLHLVNLMPLVKYGNGFYPRLRAYVFRDVARGGYLTMLTDCPSDMGRKVNTGALNGFQGFALELRAVRELTPWEKRLLRERTIFYRHSEAEIMQRIRTLEGKEWHMGLRLTNPHAHDLAEIVMANVELGICEWDKLFLEHQHQHSFIRNLRGITTREDVLALYDLTATAVSLNEYLEQEHTAAFRSVRKAHADLLADLGSQKYGGTEMARKAVVAAVKSMWLPETTIEPFKQFIATMRSLNAFVRTGRANTELISELAKIVRYSEMCGDVQYAMSLTDELIERLGLANVQLVA